MKRKKYSTHRKFAEGNAHVTERELQVCKQQASFLISWLFFFKAFME
jgi:hypothetical protein